MSTNNFRPHVHILPEDRANGQLATGFLLGISPSYASIQVLDEAGGWRVALELFESVHVRRMRNRPHRVMVILIDFDNEVEARREYAQSKIPTDLAERVFVLGSRSEPETLRAELGSYEAIGSGLAKDCRDGTNEFWGHALLMHNAAELGRLQRQVRHFLFS